MALQQVRLIFYGKWNDSSHYNDYRVVQIEIPSDSSFQQFQDCIQSNLFPSSNIFVSRLTVYWAAANNSNLIRIVDDKDIIWLMAVLSKIPQNDLCVVVDTEMYDTLGNTEYFNSNKAPADPSTQPSELDSRIIDFENFESVHSDVLIKEGALFRSKAVLKKVVYLNALNNSFQLITVRSNHTSFDIRCKDLTCSWYLRASVYKKSGVWVIRKFSNCHQCAVDIVKDDHRQATSWMVAECTKSFFKMNDKLPFRPRDVITYMKKHHGVNVSYDKAWRGREIALNSIRGTPESSYALLSSFSRALIERNPGTYTSEEADEEGRFKYYFVALAASLDAWTYCLPIISVDGASMKNKYLGTLLTACTLDGDSKTVPLAFAVVDSENDASWSWFFRNLKSAFGEPNELVIVSDAHKSIASGFSCVYQSAEHGLCAFHLLKNLKKNHKTTPIDGTFHSCARAYTVVEYEYHMRKLDDISPRIRHELESIGKQRWARAFFERKRYSLMTTNISESLNSWLKEARELPVISLLESIRGLVQKWFYERRTYWSFQRTKLSSYADGIIRGALKDSRSMNIYPINQHEFEVHYETQQFLVNILDRKCSCRRWDLDLIPCAHACIALCSRKLDLHLYTHQFFYVSNLAQLYRKETRPVGNVEQFTSMNTVIEDPVLPPQVKRPAGRPKKKRIPSFLEKKSTVRCSRCGKLGHNRRSCKEPLIR